MPYCPHAERLIVSVAVISDPLTLLVHAFTSCQLLQQHYPHPGDVTDLSTARQSCDERSNDFFNNNMEVHDWICLLLQQLPAEATYSAATWQKCKPNQTILAVLIASQGMMHGTLAVGPTVQI